MFYICRCGNVQIQAAGSSLTMGSPGKSDWLVVPSAENRVAWRFLTMNVTRTHPNGSNCKYIYCVLCSAWVFAERSDNVTMFNKPYFDTVAEVNSELVNSTVQHYRFLAKEYVAQEDRNESDATYPESPNLKAAGNRYLDDERSKTSNRIAQFEQEEWAKYDILKRDCERQLDALEKNLRDANDIVNQLGNNFPGEFNISSPASVLSPDDGFAQTDDDDPPREWRDVAPRPTDLTEADVYEMGSSDESGNDLGPQIHPISVNARDNSEQITGQNEVARNQSGAFNKNLLPFESFPVAVPQPVAFNADASDSRFMLSRSQPRAIPMSHNSGNRLAAMDNVDEDNAGDNVARAIELLARSIVSDGTELFSAPPSTIHEEGGS